MNELAPIQRAAVALKSSIAEAELTALAASTKSIVAITNPAGRAECHAAAMAARAARVAIDKAGKEARDDATAFAKAVIAEVARLTAIIEPEQNRLLAIRDEYDAKIEAEKEVARQAEAARVASLQKRVDDIKKIPLEVAGMSAEVLRNALAFAKGIEIDDSYGEMFGAAKEARGDVVMRLTDLIEAAEAREAEAARAAEARRLELEEAARVRAEQVAEAKRLREENERIKAEQAAALAELRETQAKIAAERARIAEEQAAEAARLRAEREAFEIEQAAQRAKEAAEARRVEIEAAAKLADRKLCEQEAAEEIAAKRQEQSREVAATAATNSESAMRATLISDIQNELADMTLAELRQVAHCVDRLMLLRQNVV